jgi:RNA polymerase sigma-70 factor (ECF subfamily)
MPEAPSSVLATTADAQLIAAVAAGGPTAMEVFYDRFAPLVHAIALRMLSDRTAAEELVEDVFVELWRRAATYDPARGSAATWIATITRSRGIDRLRAQRRHEAGRLPAAAEPVAGGVEPSAAVLADEERRTVAQALSQLTTEQREAVELAYFSGLSQQQIAEHLKRPLGTVKSHIRQALIHLGQVLRRDTGSHP